MEPTHRLSVLALGAVVLAGVVVAPGASGTTTDDAETSGIEFREVSAETGFEYNSTKSGIIADAGVYAADYDGDGWTDLLAVGGQRPVLFDNEGGEFARSGQLDVINESMRYAVFFDYDGDGDEDLVLLPREGAPVVLNNDGGEFRRQPDLLTDEFARPVGATVGDYDGDGCLDLFVVQNGDWTRRLPAGSGTPNVTPAEDNGNRNALYRGTCGSFESVTESAGIRGTTWSLATSMVDLDGDGRPDIHVANDFNNDVIYWNEGDGTFTRDVLPNETNRNAMSSEVEDFSGDGRPDVFVTNIDLPSNVSGEVALVADNRSKGNNLLVNEGDRRFRPAGPECGVSEGGWGWAAVGADLDNDGDTDIFHTTLEFTGRLGMELLQARQRGPEYSYPVVFERTSGSDCRFVSRNASAAGFDVVDGHGAAEVDFDRDGDVDIVVAESGGPTGDGRFRLYENVGATGRALQVRVVGGPQAYGARVSVETDAGTQTRVFHSRTDYFSQDERVLHFGTANSSTATVRVAWADGSEQTFEDVETGARVWLSRDGIEQTSPFDQLSTSRWGPQSLDSTLLGVVVFVLVVVLGAVAVGYSRYRS